MPVGSGFQVARGKVLTAAHVIAGCRFLWSRSSSSRRTHALLLGLDARVDLALLATPENLSTAALPIGEPRVGEQVDVYGFPRVGQEQSSVSTTVDSISDRNSSRTLLLLRGEEAKGVSGGPVVDANGTAVGLVVAREVGPNGMTIAVSGQDVSRFLGYMGIAARISADEAERPSSPVRARGIGARRLRKEPIHAEDGRDNVGAAIMQVGCSR